MDKRDEIIEFFGETISVYTSSQAEKDGILIAVRHPLINYITTSAFELCVKPFVVEGNEAELIQNLIDSVIVEMKKIFLESNKKEDWFYSVEVKDYKFFVALNETEKFTLMLPSDY